MYEIKPKVELAIFRHLAKFHGDRSRELGDLGAKCIKALAPILGGRAPISVRTLFKCTHTSVMTCESFTAIGRDSSEK